jgi:hypothetical protein
VAWLPDTQARELGRVGRGGYDEREIRIEADARVVFPDADGKVAEDCGVPRGAADPELEHSAQQLERCVVPGPFRHGLFRDEPPLGETGNVVLDEHPALGGRIR